MSSDELTESSSLLSGRDAKLLLDLIHKTLSCTTQDDYRDLFAKLHELFPFEYASSLLADIDKDGNFETIGSININFPDEYLTAYKAKGLLKHCVVTRENLKEFKPQFWRDTVRKTPQSEHIMSLCADFGISEGYSHGSRTLGPDGKASVFWFSTVSRDREDDTRTKVILEFVIPHFHNVLCLILKGKRSNKRGNPLSAREKEVLDWLKHGKSSWEISVILGVSERTINFHVYNIMQKLDAINRPQAVAVAARLGLIDIF